MDSIRMEYLLAHKVLIQEPEILKSLLPGLEPIEVSWRNPVERMRLSWEIVFGESLDWTIEAVQKELAVEQAFYDQITSCYLKGKELVVIRDVEVSILALDGILEDRQELVAAYMLRWGYRIEEEVGVGYYVSAPEESEVMTNLRTCSCSDKTNLLRPCEHMKFAQSFKLNRSSFRGVM